MKDKTYTVHLYHDGHSIRRVKAKTPAEAVEKVLTALGYPKYELEYHVNIMYSEGACLNSEGATVAFAGIRAQKKTQIGRWDMLKAIVKLFLRALWESRDALPRDYESPLEYTLRQ